MEWRNTTVRENTEDKSKWLKIGLEYEQRFVEYMRKYSNLDVRMNPNKEIDVKAPDLFVPGWGLCDLKTQQTPFFTASRYGIPAEHALTINHKDILRYRSLYPELGIFVWLNWENNKASGQRLKSVPYKWGVYFTTISELLKYVDNGIAKQHFYKHRSESGSSSLNKIGMNSDKNALSSYIFDSRWLDPIMSSKNNPWPVVYYNNN